MRARRTRRVLVVIVGLVVAAGLLASGAGLDAVGDVLYAAMICLLVMLCVPRVPMRVAAAVAGAWCLGVELAQATGTSASVVEVFPLLRYAVGTTFVGTDLLAYAAGVAVVAGADLWLRSSSDGSGTAVDEGRRL